MLIQNATADSVAKAVSGLGVTPREVAVVLLTGPQASPLTPFITELRATGVPFAGAVVPGLLHGHQLHRTGAILLKLPCVERPFIVTGLQHNHFDFPPLASHIAEAGISAGTALILVDGLTRNICSFLAELSGLFGNTVQYLGGGAGFPDLQQRPCLFTADGPLQDAALTLIVPRSSSLGVRHGYERMLGPIVATKTHGNRISELNWRNALEVYREVLTQDCEQMITPGNLQAISQRHPFGIMKEGAEDIVREAFSVTPSGEILCVGDIPENTVLNLLRGREDQLIAAAAAATQDCIRQCPGKPTSILMIDCVSRSALLGDRYSEELTAITGPIRDLGTNCCLEGFLSVGEIASHGESTVDFLNKTTVISAFHE